jgi:hypothetical protein
VHTPDACYGGAGYEMIDEPAPFAAQTASLSAPARLWTARFRKGGAPGAADLRIFWAWNAGGGWEAVDGPRLAFAGKPFLCKLYVIAEALSGAETQERGPGKDFLDQFLPELHKALSAADRPNNP